MTKGCPQIKLDYSHGLDRVNQFNSTDDRKEIGQMEKKDRALLCGVVGETNKLSPTDWRQ